MYIFHVAENIDNDDFKLNWYSSTRLAGWCLISALLI